VLDVTTDLDPAPSPSTNGHTQHHRRLDATLVRNLQKRPKANLSMKESAQFLLGSRYLRYMATLVLGTSTKRDDKALVSGCRVCLADDLDH
jgi:hypothetical protein